jgi:hypothetical protein
VIESDPLLESRRPLRAGLAIASCAASSGSLGAVVFERRTRKPLLLSVDHVLSHPEGSGSVWQPAPCGVSGCRCNAVARTLRGRRSIVGWREHWYYIDAAVALIEDGVSCEPSRFRVATAVAGMRVYKDGAKSGKTVGVISDTRHVDRVRFGQVPVEVPNQLLVTPAGPSKTFALAGDSGAVIRAESGEVVGLLWGADGAGRGVGCMIGPVLEHLDFVFEEADS